MKNINYTVHIMFVPNRTIGKAQTSISFTKFFTIKHTIIRFRDKQVAVSNLINLQAQMHNFMMAWTAATYSKFARYVILHNPTDHCELNFENWHIIFV